MPRAGRARPALAVGAALVGFLAVVALRSQPANPDVRLPSRFRLVGLIHREQDQAARLRAQADQLRARLQAIRADSASRQAGVATANGEVAAVEGVSGLMAVTGPGLKVTLDDSSMRTSPTGNLNDLVIQSQDVQAVVNALWRDVAEPVTVDGERIARD